VLLTSASAGALSEGTEEALNHCGTFAILPMAAQRGYFTARWALVCRSTASVCGTPLVVGQSVVVRWVR
jgi:hypothetical protein